MKITTLIVCLTVAVVSLQGKIKITATTTHVADLVTQIGGDRVVVDALMAPGVDPHLYKPSAPDVRKLSGADAIVYHGLNLEGFLGDLFERMGRRGIEVVAVTEAIPEERLLPSSEYEGQFDPHVWFDAELWSLAVDRVVALLSELDPSAREAFTERGQALKTEMHLLDVWAAHELGSLPDNQRILVTSHDAFSYLGRRYGLEVIGIQGISTAAEAGLADISGMVQLIKERNVPAIFIESSVSPAAIERVSVDSGVYVGGELLSDSLGTPGVLVEADEEEYDIGTWQGMLVYNVETFVLGVTIN
ncbi:MAG: zinc ABC transporter substrate-binding protein [Opitutales bacterium]|nr:zinc ABC transporter substrate-binding protein [Opitutales bacterium]NRA27125.1 zinc ABC transporter substrate-binding protein [Opitutales bacterium]